MLIGFYLMLFSNGANCTVFCTKKIIHYLCGMEVTTYSNFRQNLKGFMDMVFKNRVPLFVTRAKGNDVVVISKTDYESMQETIHLLSSPKNAERIATALDEYRQGKGKQKELLD